MNWDRDEELEYETEAAAASVTQNVTPPAPQGTSSSAEGSDSLQNSVYKEYQILTEAQRRLSKAQLYQALLNQSIFSQSSVQQEIVQEVSQELQQFALERLEIMLGMRSAPTASPNMSGGIFTEEEVGQLRTMLDQVNAGGIPVLGKEEAMALRLFLSKITGKTVTMPQPLVPTIKPVTVESSVPLTKISDNRRPLPQKPSPIAKPKQTTAKPKNKLSDNPEKIRMPTIEELNAKIATDAAQSPENAGSASVLSLAIQTALNNAKTNEENE